jgi:hypothetical protein
MRSLVRAQLKNTLLPKNLLRAGNAGVINDSLGGSAGATRIAQEGFARGVWKKMTVWGLDATGTARDKTVFTVDHRRADGDELTAIRDDDSIDYVTRTDAGMAEALSRTKARYDRKGLRAHTVFEFTDDIARDPQRFAREQAALGTVSVPAPMTNDAYDMEHVATVRPAKDRGQFLSFFWGRRR